MIDNFCGGGGDDLNEGLKKAISSVSAEILP